MTRSITIVNTSNWDGEPVIVDGCVLQAGERITIGMPKGEVKRIEVESARSVAPNIPFGIDDGSKDHVTQVVPEVEVKWKRAGVMVKPRDFSHRQPDD